MEVQRQFDGVIFDAAGLQPLTPTLVDLSIQQVKESMKLLPQLHLLIKVTLYPRFQSPLPPFFE